MEESKDELAIFTCSYVNSYLGFSIDAKPISDFCRKNNIYFILDLAHSVGCVDIQLNKWNVDAAVLCTYKYLNAGPGNIGALYINKDI